MLGWKGWLTTRATFAAATLPTILLACRALRAAPLAVTFETTMESGKSVLTRARKDGGPAEPTAGPAKTQLFVLVAVPVPPEAVASGVPRASVSTMAPSTTVKDAPGLDPVWIATLPSGSMTMAKV